MRILAIIPKHAHHCPCFFTPPCREHLFEEMLQEKEEVAVKRTRCKEIFNVLQQAAWVSSSQPWHYNGV